LPSRDLDRSITLPPLPNRLEDVLVYLAQLQQAIAAAHDEITERINALDDQIPE
jgi:hypothetical protein